MRWTDMYIAATAVNLPGREDTAVAVAQGRYDADEFEVNGYTSISVAPGQAPADMAAKVARDAVARSGHASADFVLVLHAGTYHQGQDYWTPAAYVQQASIGGRAPAMEVKQASNGGLASMILGMSYLSAYAHLSTHAEGDESAHRGGPAALLTTSDSFGAPAYDRYRSDKWVVFGDGATAAVISRRGGFARVLATGMDADPTLEELYRGDGLTGNARPAASHAGGPGPGPTMPVDLRARKSAYLQRVGFESVASRTSAGLTNAVGQALEHAETKMDDLAWCVFPNVGRAVMRWEFLDVLDLDIARTTWGWGAQVGHVGAGDQFGGLNHLVETGKVSPGDRVLITGSGMGFNWNAVVVEILDVPRWAA